MRPLRRGWRRTAGLLAVAGLLGVGAPLGSDPAPDAHAPGDRSAGGRPATQRAGAATVSTADLAPTAHPPVPGRLWMAPDHESGAVVLPALADLARGVRELDAGRATVALPFVSSQALAGTPLADYARYYTGLALAALERLDEAEAVLGALAGRAIPGVLPDQAALRQAALRERREDLVGAMEIYERLSRRRTLWPAQVLARLAATAEGAGLRERAVRAYERLYYEYPLSGEAAGAEAALARLDARPVRDAVWFEREWRRADTLYGARRWQEARAAYERLRPHATGATRDLAAIRMAACDVSLRRHRAARTALEPLLERGPHADMARYFHLTATRGLGLQDEYVKLVRALVAKHPDSPWAEEALDGLATHYIRADRRDQADAVFREMLARYPTGRFADRAAWRSGWWAYRDGRLDEAARVFERAAAAFPRADYRPAWLYWSGRAHERLGRSAEAGERYRLTAADYLNSYYGRLAWERLSEAGRRALPARVTVVPDAAPELPPTEPVIRALIGLALYRDALQELQYAQQVWGDSALIQATIALVRHRLGLQVRTVERFADLRGAITIMRRAYPQFMAAGGEDLPEEVLRVIFPLDYWPLIDKHARAHRLDPYLMAALVAQESTFTADIRSSANAIGLMQIIPSTGLRYARRLGIQGYSTARLREPEINVRIGMRYFADLMERFGAAHLALAGYNAGEGRVARWKADRPGLLQDEFIDDIPFPETQNYVKRILGTAEDYRRLYGPRVSASEAGGR